MATPYTVILTILAVLLVQWAWRRWVQPRLYRWMRG